MAEPCVSHDGTVYTDTDIMHPDPKGCTHEGANSCPTCDHDRYYATKHGAVCPWYEKEVPMLSDGKKRALIAEGRAVTERMALYVDAQDDAAVLDRVLDALESSLTVPDGDARERLIDAMERGEKVRQAAWTAYGAEPDGEGTRPHSDNWYRAEALLAAFPILSRDIAGEIEAEADDEVRESALDEFYVLGLRRAAEIVRNGR